MRGRRNFVDETSALTRRILEEFDTFAVVGLSSNPTKAAHSVPAAMKAYGWRIIPVNPHADRLLGEPVYRRLADIPEPVDIVNIFRRREALAGIVDESLALTPQPKAIWMQLALRDDVAAAKARAAGLTVVMDRCIKVEYARLL
jgi:predicted CoA-binding protein